MRYFLCSKIIPLACNQIKNIQRRFLMLRTPLLPVVAFRFLHSLPLLIISNFSEEVPNSLTHIVSLLNSFLLHSYSSSTSSFYFCLCHGYYYSFFSHHQLSPLPPPPTLYPCNHHTVEHILEFSLSFSLFFAH